MAKSKKKFRDGERKTLVLSTDYQVVNFTNEVRAVRMFLNGRAEVLAEWDSHVSTPNRRIPVPSVLRLLNEHRRKNGPVRFHKSVVFRRDKYTCQYCGRKMGRREPELEHIVPQCKGGLTTYKNCVTSCHSCNHRKRNRTPEEAGMQLMCKPEMPTILHVYNIDTDEGWHHLWDDYIGHLK